MKTFLSSILAIGLVATVNLSAASTSLAAGEPHMEAALEHLKAARAELEQAEKNKGGHRERALEAVDHAIEQVKDGIRFAR